MKKFAIIFVLATGCTVIEHPVGWKYKSYMQLKRIDTLSVSTNGTLFVKGYTSKDSEIVRTAIETAIETAKKP
jgi:hypothetical protein